MSRQRAGDVGDGGGGPDLAVLRTLHELIARMNSERDLGATLQAVVDGVVAGVGFRVAAVNYAHPDGSFEALAVAGPAEARAAVLGQRLPPDAFDALFARAQEWGTLRFVPHEHLRGTTIPHWASTTANPDPRPDEWHPLDALLAPLRAPSGGLVGVLSVDLPRDGRRPGAVQRELLEMFAAQAGIAVANARLTMELQRSEEAFRLAFDGAGVGMAMVGARPGESPRYLQVNPAMCQLTGYSAEELLKRGPADITHPDDLAADRAALRRAEAGELTVYRAEKRYLRADGSVVLVSLTSSVVGGGSAPGRYAISQVEDIGGRRAVEDELRHRVAHDPLTGLVNRAGLTERLAEAVGRARRSRRPGAVLFCDLDGFKAVNDRLGHYAGDTALAEIARRLAAQVRVGDTVARYGGDEFVILAEDITTSAVTTLARRLADAVRRPLSLPESPPDITVSIGIALLSEEGPDATGLLRAADAAMYEAKALGPNHYAFAAADGSTRSGGTGP